MARADEKTRDGANDLPESSTAPFQTVRTKRRQVKNACTNCQKACKKCDQARPCLRCVKYGIMEQCVDSQRKERQKGLKRGPYKKRDGKGTFVAHSQPSQEAAPEASTQAGHPPVAPPLPGHIPVGYTPTFYAMPPGHKPGEPAYYPQFYFTTPVVPGQEGENSTLPPPPQLLPQLLPATFMTPVAQAYPPYTRRDNGPETLQYPSLPQPSSDVKRQATQGDGDGPHTTSYHEKQL